MRISELKDLKDISVTMTIGSFDGLHRGHSALISIMRETAKKNRSETLIISFNPHPRQVLDSDYGMKLLNTMDEKLSILEKSGIDHIHFIPFTKEFAATKYSDFYENYIFSNLDVKAIISGSNHMFGQGRSGDRSVLAEICTDRSIDYISAEPVFHAGKTISSTRIRKAICSGDVFEAGIMLGYRYGLSGCVVRGNGLGRKIGFPTANIEIESSEKVIPAFGVYLTRAEMNGEYYPSLSYIGCKPTVKGSSALLETHIPGLDRDLYGEDITIRFVRKIRDEKAFSSIEDLKAAIGNDLRETVEVINNGGDIS
jgi:riboflavin kinase / FMN adenylyltransferase